MPSLTPSQALQRIRHYCAYQERCHSEVEKKLYGFGLNSLEVGNIISELIRDNFLNEERFAIHFAGGKFRMKGWGKQKIVRALKSRDVSEYCINRALAEIDEDEYNATFLKLADKKSDELRSEKNIFVKKRKIRDFLLRRGYSSDQIYRYLNR